MPGYDQTDYTRSVDDKNLLRAQHESDGSGPPLDDSDGYRRDDMRGWAHFREFSKTIARANAFGNYPLSILAR